MTGAPPGPPACFLSHCGTRDESERGRESRARRGCGVPRITAGHGSHPQGGLHVSTSWRPRADLASFVPGAGHCRALGVPTLCRGAVALLGVLGPVPWATPQGSLGRQLLSSWVPGSWAGPAGVREGVWTPSPTEVLVVGVLAGQARQLDCGHPLTGQASVALPPPLWGPAGWAALQGQRSPHPQPGSWNED